MCGNASVCVGVRHVHTSIQYFGFHYIANKLVATNRNCTPAETEREGESDRARKTGRERRAAKRGKRSESVEVWECGQSRRVTFLIGR